MQVMHMNWKTGKMEPCVEHRLERGQIVMGIDGPAHEYDGVVLERVENGKWGTSCRILWIDDLRVSGHQFIKPIAERFGIGVYFYPGKQMPEEKIAELEKRFLEKERAEALEAEKRRIENERLAAIGKEHFADAIKKHGKPVALILAVEHEDVSDLQTDYFDYRTVWTVVLAFSKHKRNLFPEMRKAALNSDIPEIRELATAPAGWEHREDYSGGHGYYLAESKYSGWSIEKIPLYNDEQLERFYCNAGKPGGFCVK